MSDLTLTRCGVCGIFAPQKLGYGGKIVSTPCAHRRWREIHYCVESEATNGDAHAPVSGEHVARAERIVDALLPQPDREIERQRITLLNQRWGDLGAQVQRAERAEEGLRAVTEALKDALELAEEGWAYAGDYFVKKWGFEENLARLRTVLSSHPEAQSTEERT